MKWGRWVLASVLTLLVWEILARCFITAPRSYIRDAGLGFRYIPGARVLHSSEGFSEFHYNSLGLRGPDPDLDRHPFVVVTGNSFTEADSLPDNHLFTAVAEKHLDRNGRNVQVVNAGRNGDDFFRQLILLERYFRVHRPDLVILQVDDWMLHWLRRPQSVPYRITRDDLLEFDPPSERTEPFWKTQLRRPIYYSALANLLVLRYFSLVRPDETLTPTAKISSKAAAGETTVNPDLLRAILRTFQNNYSNIVILYVPKLSYPGLVQSDPHEPLLRDTAQALNIKVYNPVEVLRADYLERRRPHFGFHNSGIGAGHLNQDGHDLVGDFLANVILENLK